jgi:hypothetical protein
MINKYNHWDILGFFVVCLVFVFGVSLLYFVIFESKITDKYYFKYEEGNGYYHSTNPYIIMRVVDWNCDILVERVDTLEKAVSFIANQSKEEDKEVVKPEK